MAKSKSGGTRSYIRGKIGADVYSIGKDGKGTKQQVVRSLAEVVSNPQTEEQMRGRMIMSTVMQAVSALSPIVDHSFDNVPKGQPSISEFIRRNYALIKADVAAHPSTGNSFGLNKYQEKGAKEGLYVISDGKGVLPSIVSTTGLSSGVGMVFSGITTGLKAGEFRTLLGIGVGDFITSVAVMDNGGLGFIRLKLNGELSDETEITAANFLQMFDVESNYSVEAYLDGQKMSVYSTSSDDALCIGLILSEKVDSTWQHSPATMVARMQSFSWKADVALPTYPQGSARFLNGGDI